MFKTVADKVFLGRQNRSWHQSRIHTVGQSPASSLPWLVAWISPHPVPYWNARAPVSWFSGWVSPSYWGLSFLAL
jgi:hypothetical protein